ncbi:hypothetical protein TYRP_003812 [Tyrophagus putrescentiae]|nr:hypothetical protein TYRP_003812 [Tyrophagus putrescentiae]
MRRLISAEQPRHWAWALAPQTEQVISSEKAEEALHQPQILVVVVVVVVEEEEIFAEDFLEGGGDESDEEGVVVEATEDLVGEGVVAAVEEEVLLLARRPPPPPNLATTESMDSSMEFCCVPQNPHSPSSGTRCTLVLIGLLIATMGIAELISR